MVVPYVDQDGTVSYERENTVRAQAEKRGAVLSGLKRVHLTRLMYGIPHVLNIRTA